MKENEGEGKKKGRKEEKKDSLGKMNEGGWKTNEGGRRKEGRKEGRMDGR